MTGRPTAATGPREQGQDLPACPYGRPPAWPTTAMAHLGPFKGPIGEGVGNKVKVLRLKTDLGARGPPQETLGDLSGGN